MTEYFHPDYPKLYRLGGEYLPGLAKLFGAHECHEGKAHDIEAGKCTKCSVQAKEST
jgi:hypothetical protein